MPKTATRFGACGDRNRGPRLSQPMSYGRFRRRNLERPYRSCRHSGDARQRDRPNYRHAHELKGPTRRQEKNLVGHPEAAASRQRVGIEFSGTRQPSDLVQVRGANDGDRLVGRRHADVQALIKIGAREEREVRRVRRVKVTLERIRPRISMLERCRRGRYEDGRWTGDGLTRNGRRRRCLGQDLNRGNRCAGAQRRRATEDRDVEF